MNTHTEQPKTGEGAPASKIGPLRETEAAEATRREVSALLGDPGVMEREMLVSRLFERGLEESAECIGYHGMSLEALEQLMRCGRIPTGTNPNGENVQKRGNFHFFGKKSAFPSFDLPEKNDGMTMKEAAADYAALNGQDHCFARILGLDLSDPEDQEAIHGLVIFDTDEVSRKAWQILKKRGFAKEQVKEALRLARRRKGVVIGIHKDALHHLEASSGLEENGELVVNCPEGFDIHWLSGIEPCGDEEYEALEHLQEKVERRTS